MDPKNDAAIDALLSQVMPLVEPPEGELPDANLVTALVEGRLPPGVAQRVTRQIGRSPAARSELRALYPERFAEIFQPPVAPPATVPRWRGPALGALTLVAAAALAFYLVPPETPQGSALTVAPDSDAHRVRGAAAPGQRFAISMNLGTASRWDRLRGHEPFGALFVTDPSGHTRLVCTTVDRRRCTAAEGTLGYLFVAPSARGAYTLSLLSAPEALAPSELTAILSAAQRAPDPLASLSQAAAERSGQLLRAEPIRVE